MKTMDCHIIFKGSISNNFTNIKTKLKKLAFLICYIQYVMWPKDNRLAL